MERWLRLALLCAGAASVAMAWASPPTGVTPNVLSRGSYPAFSVEGAREGGVDFQAKSGAPVDVIVRRHEYAPHGQTGWHTHPGPIFITVVQGTVKFYERNDPSCTPKIVKAGEGYVDDGHGHLGVNDSDEPAVDVSVILAPVGKSFRDELPAPGPACKF